MDTFRSQGFTRFTPDWAPSFGDTAAPAAPSPTGEHGSPPSSYAVVAVLDGQNGSLLRLIGLTLLRGAFVVPGLFLTAKVMKIDLELYDLLALSFGGSVAISLGMLGYYWIRRKTGAEA